MCVVNLDPANENYKYKADIDIRDHIALESVMNDENLGPNGGMIRCFELLAEEINWFEEKLISFLSQDTESSSSSPFYFLFDFPGQVELFTHSSIIENLILSIKTKLNINLSVINLIDSHHFLDLNRFVSVSILTLTTMLRLKLPQVNVFTKFDLILKAIETEDRRFDVFKELKTQFKTRNDKTVEYFINLLPLEIHDIIYSADENLLSNKTVKDLNKVSQSFIEKRTVESDKTVAVNEKLEKLNEMIGEVISDYSLLAYQKLNIFDKRSVIDLLAVIDKTNGYVQPDYEEESEDEEKRSTFT